MNPRLIDTHAHLQFPDFTDDLETVLKNNNQKNITCINVGTDFASSESAVTMAQKHDGLYAVIGLHPTDVDEPLDISAYRQLAQSEKVVAIGEIGLDYFREPYDAQKQKEIFLQQLALAKELTLPVIIHCRKAHPEMIGLLQGQGMQGVIHCFTGTWAQAQQYLDLGFYLGINGIIFKFNIDETIKKAPLEKLLLETDCPFLTPPMAPQKRNEPLFMEYTVQKIAELRGITTEEVAQKTTENAKKLFGI